MKTKLSLTFILTGVLLAVVGCAQATPSVTPQNSTNVTEADFQQTPDVAKQMDVALGSTVTVTLVSNASTGFQWSQQAQISDASILQQTGHQYIAAAATTPPVVGASGKEVWTFKTLKPGTTTVSMVYSRNWPGGENAARTFKLMVTVK